MRPLPQLILYTVAWIATSLAISQIAVSLSGVWKPFSSPGASSVEGPGGYAVNVIMVECFFGLLNGALQLLLLSVLLQRLPRNRNIVFPSILTGLVLGLICVGGWNGFLYLLMGHLSHPSIEKRLAVGILPYIVSGTVAGFVRPQPSKAA